MKLLYVLAVTSITDQVPKYRLRLKDLLLECHYSVLDISRIVSIGIKASKDNKHKNTNTQNNMIAIDEKLLNPLVEGICSSSAKLSPVIAQKTPQKRFGNKLRLLMRAKSMDEHTAGSKKLHGGEPTSNKLVGKGLRRENSMGSTETATSIATTTNEDSRAVSFGSIEIREHGRILVDHPACADGLALGLDWKHSKKVTVYQIDLYEKIRKAQGKRGQPSNKLCTYDKKMLLMKVGGYKEKALWEVFKKTCEGNNTLTTPAA